VISRRIAQMAISIALVTIVGGCATNPSRFYTLESTATPGAGPALPISVLVGPVAIPASVDQPQFVVQVAPNRVDVDEFNRWAAPLSDSIARALAGDLSTQLGTPNVAIAPMANFQPTYRVTVDVQRFESIQGQSAIVDAVWTVRKTSDGETRSGRTFAQETVQDGSFEALAAAHSRAIAKMSDDIAASIRSEAAPS